MARVTAKQVAQRIATTQVGHIMIPLERYPHVTASSPLRKAMQVLDRSALAVNKRKSQASVLLVLGRNKRIAGIARRRDLMRGLEPAELADQPLSYRKKLFDTSADPLTSERAYEKLVLGVWERASRPVSEVMRPVGVTIEHDALLVKAIYEMVSYGVTTLPVMKGKRLVGVLRSVEVFHQMAEVVG